MIASNGAGWRPAFSLESKQIYFREKKGSRLTGGVVLKVYNVNNGKVDVVNNVNPDATDSYYLARKDRHPIVFVNYKTTQLEAEFKDRSRHWILSSEQGFYLPLLSPDRNLVAVHQGINVLVFKADGGGLVCKFARGLVSSWSPDSKNLIGFLEAGSGKPGSEIYIYNIASASSYPLTQTKNINETYPYWSADGKKIVFADSHSGSIFIANIGY